MLKTLAVAAYEENGNIALATDAFAVAMALDCSDGVRTALENDWAELQLKIETRKGKELRMEADGNVLQINQEGIDFNGQWVGAADLEGFRHKVEAGKADAAAETYMIAWRAIGGREFELNSNNLLCPSEGAGRNYAQILDAFYCFFVPDLIDRLVAAIRRGDEVLIGETPMKKKGMVLASQARFGARDELVTYETLDFKIEDGQLSLSSKLNPWLFDSYVVADTWNGVLFSQLIGAVQQE
jgi:hypothetical protein